MRNEDQVRELSTRVMAQDNRIKSLEAQVRALTEAWNKFQKQIKEAAHRG